MFGKNKCKITWPLFHLFIREEESETKKEIFNLENQLPKKLNKIIKIDTNFQTQNNKQNIIDNKDILIKENIFRRNWLKFNEYSCRHDSFFFLYCFVLYPRLKDIKDNVIIKMYNLMVKEILKMDLDELNKGVWDLILNYKNKEFDLSKYCFKEYFTVL